MRSLMMVVLTFNLQEKIDWGLKSFVISCCFCDFNRFFVAILKLKIGLSRLGLG
jgi:hypothetical protein